MTPFGSWQFIDAHEINELHDATIAKYGGMPGVRDNGCPAEKIGNAKNAVLYAANDNDDPDLLSAAAYLIVYLAKGHCYIDGNKRIAWLAALRLLHINGIELRGDETEAASLIERVAQSQADVAEVIAWLGRAELLFACAEVESSNAVIPLPHDA